MPEKWEQEGLAITHSQHDTTGEQLVEALKPFLGSELDDATGLVVVVRYEEGHFQVFGPHKIVESAEVLHGAMHQIAKSIRHEDVIDYMAEQVVIPDDLSELDSL